MNRRNFLKFLGVASVGTTVAYSFPSIIVPKNIIDPFVGESQLSFVDTGEYGFGFTGFKGQEYLFDLIDADIREAIKAAEKAMNLQFFGSPVTLEEIHNSHV